MNWYKCTPPWKNVGRKIRDKESSEKYSMAHAKHSLLFISPLLLFFFNYNRCIMLRFFFPAMQRQIVFVVSFSVFPTVR